MNKNDSKDVERFEENRIRIPILKYFWEASPLIANKKQGIHKFLKSMNILNNFTDLELLQLTRFLHLRSFLPGEIVFNEGDSGLGFYLIYAGNIHLYINKVIGHSENQSDSNYLKVTSLQKGNYLGEQALLEDNNKRSATAIAYDNVILLGMYKPDLAELLERHPRVAAKFLQSLSMIIAKRLFSVTTEMRCLKEQLADVESDEA
jgi:CRP-like cAMP-binding protein